LVSGVDFEEDGDHSASFSCFQNRTEEGGTDAARACCGRNVEFFERANDTAMFRAEEGGGIGNADDLRMVASHEEESKIRIDDDFLEDWQELSGGDVHLMFGELSNEKFRTGGTIRMSGIGNGEVMGGHL
jgi:hypothetical protein